MRVNVRQKALILKWVLRAGSRDVRGGCLEKIIRKRYFDVASLDLKNYDQIRNPSTYFKTLPAWQISCLLRYWFGDSH